MIHKLQVTASTRYSGETKITQTGRDVSGILARYGFGYVGPNEMKRQVTGGPLVPGPWAYAYRLGNCIDGTRQVYNDVEFSIGDQFEIDGHIFQSYPANNDNMDLRLVS